MPKKKMCKWLIDYVCRTPTGCPRNTNSRCEIIPAKRTKTVKGWAYIKTDYIWGNSPVCCGAKMFKDEKFNIPCTITYQIKEEI